MRRQLEIKINTTNTWQQNVYVFIYINVGFWKFYLYIRSYMLIYNCCTYAYAYVLHIWECYTQMVHFLCSLYIYKHRANMHARILAYSSGGWMRYAYGKVEPRIRISAFIFKEINGKGKVFGKVNPPWYSIKHIWWWRVL